MKHLGTQTTTLAPVLAGKLSKNLTLSAATTAAGLITRLIRNGVSSLTGLFVPANREYLLNGSINGIEQVLRSRTYLSKFLPMLN
jgi:hypothetical protein